MEDNEVTYVRITHDEEHITVCSYVRSDIFKSQADRLIKDSSFRRCRADLIFEGNMIVKNRLALQSLLETGKFLKVDLKIHIYDN